jgi:hypothetical protein
MVVVSMDAILKHNMSLKHPLSSQPPNNIHTALSARVTVCARNPWVGSAPQTGAKLQYITGGGVGPTSCIFGRRGTVRKRTGGGWSGAGVRGDLARASRGIAESAVEVAVDVRRRRVVVVLVGESPGVLESGAMSTACVGYARRSSWRVALMWMRRGMARARDPDRAA